MVTTRFIPVMTIDTYLKDIPEAAGQIIFTEDTKKIYLDDRNDKRVQICNSNYVYVSATQPTMNNGDVWLVLE